MSVTLFGSEPELEEQSGAGQGQPVYSEQPTYTEQVGAVSEEMIATQQAEEVWQRPVYPGQTGATSEQTVSVQQTETAQRQAGYPEQEPQAAQARSLRPKILVSEIPTGQSMIPGVGQNTGDPIDPTPAATSDNAEKLEELKKGLAIAGSAAQDMLKSGLGALDSKFSAFKKRLK